MSTLALSLGMSAFKALCLRFSPERAIMVRGRPGIGKSQSVWQIAAALRDDTYKSLENCRKMTEQFHGERQVQKSIRKFWSKNGKKPEYSGYDQTVWHYDMGIPVVERRLSQLQEGDVVGIPFDGGLGTVFKPTEWLILTALWPSILFLDELNRATKQVEQATFQIADSKAFYGHTLHEGTRVYVAVNIGDEFDVQSMDPAAISRYAVIDLEPSLEDWVAWAKETCNPALPAFMVANPSMLEWRQTFEPNRKVHDRRAWGNLDAELTHAGLYENPNDTLFLHMAASMVGFAAGNAFWNFCKERALDVSAEDILKNWKKVKERLPSPTTKDAEGREVVSDKYITKLTELSGKVVDYVATHKLTAAQVKNCAEFMRELPAEHMSTVWKSMMKVRENFTSIHPLIKDMLVRIGGGKPAAAPATKK